MKILIMAAHFDDEVYGCGGTIARLTQEGHEVYVCVLTDSCSSQYKDRAGEMIMQKKEESKKVNDILGIKKTISIDLPDMKLDTIPHVELNKPIEECIKKIRPEIVYTNYFGDVNKDHRLVFESTIVAVRPVEQSSVRRVLCYELPSSTEWNAQTLNNIFISNVFVNIEKTIDKKIEAVRAYKSELREYPHPRSIENVVHQAHVRGASAGLEAAECFMLIREIDK